MLLRLFMRDLSRRRDTLLDLGQKAADGLTHFVNLQDSMPKRRSENFNPAGFRAQSQEGIRTKEYFESLVSELMEVSKIPATSDIEEDYTNTLGSYLSDLVECVSAYIELCFLFTEFDRSNKLKMVLPMFRAHRRYRKTEKQYLKTGVNLSALWNIYNRIDLDEVSHA